MKRVCSFALACVGSLVLASGASAQPSTLHKRTVQIPGTQCSVTATKSFTTVNGVYWLNYGGGISCARNVGQKTLDVVPQVFNRVAGKPLWFNIGGAGLFQGPAPANPLRLTAARPAVATHQYRLLVYGRGVLPGGKTASVTVCPDCQAAPPTLSISPPHGFVYTWPAVAVRMPGLPCSVMVVQTRFPYINGTPVMQYGGEMTCTTNLQGNKRLEIKAQVGGQGPKATYYTINGSTLSATGTASFLTLGTGRTVYIGHPYRVMAVGTIKSGGRTVTATAYSLTAGP